MNNQQRDEWNERVRALHTHLVENWLGLTWTLEGSSDDWLRGVIGQDNRLRVRVGLNAREDESPEPYTVSATSNHEVILAHRGVRSLETAFALVANAYLGKIAQQDLLCRMSYRSPERVRVIQLRQSGVEGYFQLASNAEAVAAIASALASAEPGTSLLISVLELPDSEHAAASLDTGC